MMRRQQQQQHPQKRGLTLDFNSSPSVKKTRLSSQQQQQHIGGAGPAAVLTTPDVQMLKLSSPELAKFLSGNNGLPTPTPSGYAVPKTVTEEQALYAKGFEDALKKMHSKPAAAAAAAPAVARKSVAPTAAANSNLLMAASAIAEQPPLPVSLPGADSLAVPETVRVKEEEDYEEEEEEDQKKLKKGGRRSSRPELSTSPIDMDSQEQIKLERKRMRNRVAASKCRQRKLERIAQLDGKVSQLKGENAELGAVIKRLKDSVCHLKQEVMEHVNSGCHIMVTDMSAI